MQTQGADRREDSKSTIVVEHIRTKIKKGHLRPGDRFPPERELAKMLSVSRASLRTGVSFLTAMGLTEVRPSVGTFVSEAADSLAQQTHLRTPAENTSSPNDIQEARCLIGSDIARMAARRRKKEHLLSMADELAEMCTALDDTQAFLRHSLSFHRSVAAAANNPILSAIFEELVNPRHEEGGNCDPQASGLQISIKSHMDIYRAIRCCDSEAAAEAMVNYFSAA